MAGIEGAWLGNYHILRRIGGGGMGDVYLAEQPELGRPVAIKVLRAEASLDTSLDEKRQAMQRFITEARSIAALEHPHITPIYDFGEQNSILYLVMQYVPFGSLSDYLTYVPSQGYRLPLPPPLVADLISQAAGALQFAHDHNIVHLDVKPQNLLLRILPLSNMPVSSLPFQSGSSRQGSESAGEVSAQLHLLLADFGLARFITWISSHSGISGTPLYSAPEQYQGQASQASDQYALACVAYLLLTGVPVFKGAVAELYHQHLSVVPRLATEINPHLPLALNSLLAKALAKDPAQRFPRIQDFGQALQQTISVAGLPQAYLVPNSGVRPTGELSALPAGQILSAAQQGAQTPSSPAPWYGLASPSPNIPMGIPPSSQLPQPLIFDPERGNTPGMLSSSPSLPAVHPVTPAALTPELQRPQDGPRAPLPRSAQKFLDSPSSPVKRWIFRARRLPLWQQLCLAGLAGLLVVGVVVAFLLILHRAGGTGSVQHVVALLKSMAPRGLPRYGQLSLSVLPIAIWPPLKEHA